MIKLVVELAEVKNERNAINIGFRTETEHPTDEEKFWEGRLSPVLKETLRTLLERDSNG